MAAWESHLLPDGCPRTFSCARKTRLRTTRRQCFAIYEIVRSLWRGERVEFEAPDGNKVGIVSQPRPVSSELPIWVTTAGNPDTYREAAKLGANVLTHLLGQSIAEVGEKIALYRETLRELGRNPSDYTVTLMLHTLVGDDREQVRDVAREPMKAYLRSAVALIKQFAWAFPAFKKPAGIANALDIDLQSLDPEELDAIIEFAFLRYFDDSGLFGTVDDALARVEQVKAIGVDEIACLIDFGVPSATAMEALDPLAKVVAAANGGEEAFESPGDFSIGGLIRSHNVTHLQFTPSMAAMLLMDEDTRRALKDVRHLFVGGEALQAALVRELRSVTDATIDNMYGPTETTIWSATTVVGEQPDGVVPLGTPIANTQLYVLDHARRPVPAGQPGELFIGGDGVARGYLRATGTHGRTLSAKPVHSPRPDVSHRRFGAPGRARRDTFHWPGRPSGESARLPHRTRRDRSASRNPSLRRRGCSGGARRQAKRCADCCVFAAQGSGGIGRIVARAREGEVA